MNIYIYLYVYRYVSKSTPGPRCFLYGHWTTDRTQVDLLDYAANKAMMADPNQGKSPPFCTKHQWSLEKIGGNGQTLPSSIHLELTGSQWRQSCLPRTSVAQWKIWGTLGMPLGWSVLVSISYVVFKPPFNPSTVRVLNSLYIIQFELLSL